MIFQFVTTRMPTTINPDCDYLANWEVIYGLIPHISNTTTVLSAIACNPRPPIHNGIHLNHLTL